MNMDMDRKIGFPPVVDKDCKVLILGSFPSVKSREISFYYGNKQNRFWKMLCTYFQEDIPQTIEGKKEFLLRRHIALWDMAISCVIQGSADSTMEKVELVDLNEVFSVAPIQKILLNGTKAYELFLEKYKDVDVPYQKMTSTSPANPRYNQEEWWLALDEIFGIS